MKILFFQQNPKLYSNTSRNLTKVIKYERPLNYESNHTKFTKFWYQLDLQILKSYFQIPRPKFSNFTQKYVI